MLKIVEKLREKSKNMYGVSPVTIAFLGDSVTQGCFELSSYDYKSAYSTRLKEALHVLYPNAQINIINSGICGDNATLGEQRLERDVLAYNPDLVVVSYGLNDSTQGIERIMEYEKALTGIFERLTARGVDIVFMTQNVMNTQVSPYLQEKELIDLATTFANDVQNNGVLHAYFERAKKICEKYNVKVCDLHPIWERLIEIGVNTTELLANKLNHPIREIHYYMAIKLLETIIS